MISRVFAALGKSERLISVPMLPALLDVAGLVIPGRELNGEVARRMSADLDFDVGLAAQEFGYAPRPFLPRGIDDLFGDDR